MSNDSTRRVRTQFENPGIEVLHRVSESLRQMTSDELFQLSVDAGIHRPDGRLTPEYGGAPDEPHVPAK